MPNIFRLACLASLALVAASPSAWAVKVRCTMTVNPDWQRSLLNDKDKSKRAMFDKIISSENARLDKMAKKVDPNNKARKQDDKRCGNSVKKERDDLVTLRKEAPYALSCMCVNGEDQDKGSLAYPTSQNCDKNDMACQLGIHDIDKAAADAKAANPPAPAPPISY